MVVNLLTLNRSKNIIHFCQLWTSQTLDKTSGNFTDFKQHSQSGHIWLPTPHCAALVWLRGRHATPLVTRYFPPILYRECYGFERVFFVLRRFFASYSLLLVLRLPRGQQFNLRVSTASCWSSKHSPSQTIVSNDSSPQKSILVGSNYVPKASFGERVPQLWSFSFTDFKPARVPQPWNHPMTGLEPAFLRVPCISSRLSRRLGHRALKLVMK